MTKARRTALVTGSTSGIGLGIAQKLAANGYNIVLNGFANAEVVRDLLDEIRECGVDAIYHPADLSKPDEIKSMIDITLEHFGSLDVLVNNAGIQHVAPLDEFPEDKLEAIIRVDLLAAFYTTKYALPSMKEAKWGRVINISSAHGLVASAFKAPYVAAKHGVVGMTKSVALEVAEAGITVNSICPGYTDTPLVRGQIAASAKTRGITEEEVIRDVMLGEQATKKFVKVDEIAALVLFLCTEDACSITGAALSIDGGWTSH